MTRNYEKHSKRELTSVIGLFFLLATTGWALALLFGVLWVVG